MNSKQESTLIKTMTTNAMKPTLDFENVYSPAEVYPQKTYNKDEPKVSPSVHLKSPKKKESSRYDN